MKTTAILMDDEVAVKIEEWARELGVTEDQLVNSLLSKALVPIELRGKRNGSVNK